MLHGGGMPVHVPGEGWAKRAGKMPHGAVTSLSPSRRKALTQDGRRAGGQAGSGNDPGRPRHGRRAGRKRRKATVPAGKNGRVLHKECYNGILQLRSSLCNTVQNVRQSGL